ncbi:MAG: lipase [Pseudonocardiaceae bacterium]|nr:lipase [Pseudonocardiaceae bacterium]
MRVAAVLLEQSLTCTGNVAAGDSEPVLLIPGTGLTPEPNFAWNYQRAFDAVQRPYCTVALPNHAMSDIQISAEYVVHALRALHRSSGEDVDVIGYSQGGMIGRWALKFWPDTRHLVDDLVGLAPSNHGTVDADVLCRPGCAPSVHQQRADSRFLHALNSGPETFEGIDYTVAYTFTDEVVFPNFGPPASSPLRTGDGEIANIAVQDICPGHTADHLAMGTFDPVAYAIAVDAVDGDGPADADRIDGAVCSRAFMPGVDPATFPADFAAFSATAGNHIATYPRTPSEPPLAPYARP